MKMPRRKPDAIEHLGGNYVNVWYRELAAANGGKVVDILFDEDGMPYISTHYNTMMYLDEKRYFEWKARFDQHLNHLITTP